MIINAYKRSAVAGLCLFAMGAAGIARAQVTETVLYNFLSAPSGAFPNSRLARDAAGNFYGTTKGGGRVGLGAVYKVSVSGTGTTLYGFTGGDAGTKPSGGLAIDSTGNLYGTAEGGGTHKVGLVYKLSESGQETVLYSFAGHSDGRFPSNGVTLDSAGNLYGTTHKGGVHNRGVVFKVDATGNETVLYRFPGGVHGLRPSSGVTLDGAGNLYGTTRYGGAHNHGVVYKLDSADRETVLYSFASDETLPTGDLVMDTAGNLYGVTYGREGSSSGDEGTVYKLNSVGQRTVLHRFKGGSDGALPTGGVAFGANGSLYGTTRSGGTGGVGVLYEIDAAGKEMVLHSFSGTDGGAPNGVVVDSNGSLYGTTATGGPQNLGVVFKYGATGQVTLPIYFSPTPGGAGYPYPGIVRDSAGNFYGTAGNGEFVVYKVDPSGQERVLYAYPSFGYTGTGIAMDSASNLYGTVLGGPHAEEVFLWKLNPKGEFTLLYNLGSCNGPPVSDPAGNLYGACYEGGTAGYGTLYEFSARGQFTVLHNFADGADGGYPQGGVTLDSAGNVFGAAGGGGLGHGALYEWSASGEFSVLYNFTGGADGSDPGIPTVDAAGNLYGVAHNMESSYLVYELDTAGNYEVLYNATSFYDTPADGSRLAVDANGNVFGAIPSGVYEVDTAGNFTILQSFAYGDAGGTGGVILDSEGNLYGIVTSGGEWGTGLLFKLSGVAAAKPNTPR